MSTRTRLRDLWPRASLGRQIALIVAANTLLLLAGLTLLFGVSERRRVRLEAATADFVEEGRIAGRINQAVLEQLIAVSAADGSVDPRIRENFLAAGEEVNEETRRYLQRDLTAAERLELERIREEHQRLEVAAARAFQIGGTPEQQNAARQGVFQAAISLRTALADFLGLRQETLHELAEQQRALLAALRFGALGLALVLLAFTLAFAGFLNRRLTVPLRALARATGEVEAGQTVTRVVVRHDDELGHLADSFNRMASSVAEARRVLEQRNTELGEALQRLRDAQADLVQTEKLGALGRMIAGLAHELNNPLASVLGHSELLAARLADGDVPDEEELREEFVEPVVHDASRARDLVRSLLQFSRRSAPELDAVPLADAIGVVEGLRRFAFEHAGAELRVEVPPVHVLAERQRLQQVFLNLVNNALEAMSTAEPAPGRALRIHATRDGGWVTILFDDDGPGVARPDRVFDPFYTTKDVGEGTGLGLTLVHGFIDEFGGDIRVENRAEGGARFAVRLREAEAAAPAIVEAPVALERRPATRAPARADGPRVLVVEDEAPLRRLQEQILLRIGAEVHLASSGNEAKRMLEELQVDLVVSDVKMPDGNGIELWEWIRRERPELREKVLLVTGNLGDPAVIDIAEQEPERVVGKPFSREEYVERVEAALGRHGSTT